MRFLLILIVIFLAVLSLRALLAKPANTTNTEKPRHKPGGNESMVPCAHCDLHIPKSEAVSSQGRFFCSTEHQLAWQHKQDGGTGA